MSEVDDGGHLDAEPPGDRSGRLSYGQARALLDGLWQRIEPLLPTIESRYRNPGRKRIDDHKALCWISFMLYIAIPWKSPVMR
ncbi:hypothetical protein [Streptosporangium sp. CA-115845]|uniref:hypothetical protein n=1 Tax=Streptosporangium sp. CA-115845 TaxID=3240071 RepID=UPI003D8D04BB